MCVARLTTANLQERQSVSEDKATSRLPSVRHIYCSKLDPNYARAKARLVGITTYQWAKEQATQNKILLDEALVCPHDHALLMDQLARRRGILVPATTSAGLSHGCRTIPTALGAPPPPPPPLVLG